MKIEFKKILKKCYEEKKSLIAFNVQNLYHLQALKEITEELKQPVIVQFSERYVKQFENRYGFDFLKKNYKNEYLYFHLDHCQNLELIKFCIDNDFEGVMYDGSCLPLKENINITKQVIDMARTKNCLVEGELGEIGGVEDGFGSESMTFANLQDVKKYVDSTSVSLLALGIGNAHGFYSTFKNIDISILSRARQLLSNDQFFVLHGGSGMPDEMIYEAINYGVVKVNFSTQIKQSTNDSLIEYLEKGELFNEINFERILTKNLKKLFKELIKKYTI
jgi:ketose-bisphosphate aldolase